MLAILRSPRVLRGARAVPLGQRFYSSEAAAPVECYVEHLGGADKGIAVLSLHRPATRNALGKNLIKQMRESLSELQFNRDVRAVVVRSLITGIFCTGADLKERAKMNQDEVAVFVHTLRSTFSELEALPIPTIAAIDGAALGGGLELSLACDIRVAGNEAKLGLPETRLAIIPGAGGTQRLPRIVSVPIAKELIFTGRILNNKEAKEIGLVNHAVDSAYEKSLDIAREILPKGPIAVRMAKIAVEKGAQLDKANGMTLEQACYAQVIPTEDRLEGLRAFQEKRPPVYKGC